MRKCYVLGGWTPEDGYYVSGIFTSKKKAEIIKALLEDARQDVIYNIQTDVLL